MAAPLAVAWPWATDSDENVSKAKALVVSKGEALALLSFTQNPNRNAPLSERRRAS
jgi:hypothetical protein